MNVTPAMKQYYDMKQQYSDAILFFRMWDFYEMFEDDAKIANKILWIALTTRNKNADNPVLLAGIPYHAKEKYLPMLIEAWYKVAIAEQVSDPKAKWIVERQVMRVITPATIGLEGESYEDVKSSNTIVSLVKWSSDYWISIINFSNHSWKTSEFTTFEQCATQLYKLSPAEIILEKSLYWNTEIHDVLTKKYNLNIYYREYTKNSYESLTTYFATKNLESFGIEDKLQAQRASAMLIEYVTENQNQDMDFLHKLSYESFSWYMDLDDTTIKSLDLVFNFATNSKTKWTLLWVLDTSKTQMWKRYLREQILHPLQDIKEIQQRQKFIAACKQDTILLSKLRENLKYIIDLDMLLSRLSLERIWPKDLLMLKRSLIAVREIIELIEKSENKTLKNIFN